MKTTERSRGFLPGAILTLLMCAVALAGPPGADAAGARYSVFAVNDLGMHCYQRSYAGFMVLPPANNVKVQVFRKGGEGARLVTSGIRVTYRIVNNTRSANKTDFWKYAASYGFVGLKPNVGITGNGLSGRMKLDASKRFWIATAIPITPYDDAMKFDPLQVARIEVRSTSTGKVIAVQPKVVVPVSDEMRCDYCHGPRDTTGSILQAHDADNGTTLYADLQAGTRHACSQCHRDNALAAPGMPGVEPLSQAMHGFHAGKTSATTVAPDCYTCHPGAITKCLRGRMPAFRS